MRAVILKEGLLEKCEGIMILAATESAKKRSKKAMGVAEK